MKTYIVEKGELKVSEAITKEETFDVAERKAKINAEILGSQDRIAELQAELAEITKAEVTEANSINVIP